MPKYDVIIVGAGHNGLVAAGYLAKAGLKTLVLERRPVVGGAAITDEIHPGFLCSSLAHSTAPFSAKVTRDLNLSKHGLELITPPVRLLMLGGDSPSLCIHQNVATTVRELKGVSANDATSYPEFEKTFARIGKVLAPLLMMTPPSLEKSSPGEMWQIGKLGRSFRKLAKKDAYRLLRWGPMAVADLVAEWFETELLRAGVAARGIFGAFAGPWSAGTSAELLWQSAMDGHAIGATSFVKGGMGKLPEALASAARSFGVEIKTDSETKLIDVEEGHAARVVLKNGDTFEARAIASNADPRSTFLDLLDPIWLDPGFLLKIRNYRARGVSAKINLALSALPAFTDLNGDVNKLAGRIHVGPEIDYLERAFDAAKFGDYSQHPYLDITIPSLADSTLAPSGAHVMSIYVQYAPLELVNGDWKTRREEFVDNVINTLADYAPNLRELIVARQIITPVDLEETFGLSGGHIHHGEQALDQMFSFRPMIGWAQYRTPIDRLYLCGAGTHPGGGITGLPGANAAREIIRDSKK